MIQFLLRFVGAGALVAVLPLVAQRFGDRSAGVVLLFPAVTLSGLLVIGFNRGLEAVSDASLGALAGLPVVAIFVLTVHIMTRWRTPLLLALAIALLAWLASAIIFIHVVSQLGEDL